ncbi:MAG: NAD-dependent protein deacylase [Planctomycetes bacterium]|nr:NAD-dependent protein deacylase [Planctomycetota bacterium]
MDDIDKYSGEIDQVVDHLEASRSLLLITGAGISADSGLPTYRGIGGLYNVNDTEEGLPIEELLSGRTMSRAPELTWKYLAQIARACQGATYNRAHEVAAEMEKHFDRLWVLTQNVDGFHRAAGSKRIVDIHGDLHDLMCTACDYRETVTDYSEISVPPFCPRCDAIVRPDVVLFGEMLPMVKVELLHGELEEGFDLVFTIGTTSVFPYIVEPVIAARRMGRPTIEINPGATDVSDLVDIKLPLRAAAAMDAIWSRYQQRQTVQ